MNDLSRYIKGFLFVSLVVAGQPVWAEEDNPNYPPCDIRQMVVPGTEVDEVVAGDPPQQSGFDLHNLYAVSPQMRDFLDRYFQKIRTNPNCAAERERAIRLGASIIEDLDWADKFKQNSCSWTTYVPFCTSCHEWQEKQHEREQRAYENMIEYEVEYGDLFVADYSELNDFTLTRRAGGFGVEAAYWAWWARQGGGGGLQPTYDEFWIIPVGTIMKAGSGVVVKAAPLLYNGGRVATTKVCATVFVRLSIRQAGTQAIRGIVNPIRVIRTALKLEKQGLTRAGACLKSHATREGGKYWANWVGGEVRNLTVAQWNALAKAHVKAMLKAKGCWTEAKNGLSIYKFVKGGPGGIKLNPDGTFNTFAQGLK